VRRCSASGHCCSNSNGIGARHPHRQTAAAAVAEVGAVSSRGSHHS
jgi:hypothetical protein